jgi:D-tyrosyl-tRNA(Tyr) deacylase
MDEAQADWLVEKIVNLRILEDQAGKMNLSLRDFGGKSADSVAVYHCRQL